MARKKTSEPDINYGTFTKGDKERVAASQAAAVRFRFDGWTETKPATEAAVAELEAVTNPDTL